GFAKLQKFAFSARTPVEFAWSDTCRIDKQINVELDEPRRSMFRWYPNSAHLHHPSGSSRI
ncbi:hypothetical protein EV424DRAFT_1330252, partial [Suillus variegatus]